MPKKTVFVCVCVCMRVCVCTHKHRCLWIPEAEVKEDISCLVWEWRTDLSSSESIVHTLKCSVIALACSSDFKLQNDEMI